ncbi:MAG: helix-turn-helix domain-containing protein [Proteobacteria bacterium]|nr:helix-turn-helix domain-containing protein [Pseudomonadota bacterium]MBU1585158.1 helix-turn-helix domain-containing protein [Pseudomonadota bacterium]MBU2454471.1 helix-turn-helix domain-containing protein [Pseudomonadota bacterium]MBU2629284.1 helix-turn-helix domain-containing protein [Pseudomonadota bacterium]
MNPANDPDIICRLKEIRNGKKITQTQLADLVGIKRQAIYDLEVGRYLPNTSVALRLARVLGCNVEDIFYEISQNSHPIALVDYHGATDPRVNVAKIRNKLFAYSLSGANSIMEEMKGADGLLEPGNNRVTLLKSNEQVENTALLMGCDPAFSILGHYVQKNHTNADLLCRFASSGKALSLLATGQAHIAGIHMHSKGSIDGNQEFIHNSLKNFKGLLVAFSTFEEGLMVALGNPLNIREPSDLAQKEIRFVNREKGAALRDLLDDCLCKSNIPFAAVNGYNDIVTNHSHGAQRILHGICDAALGLHAVATAFNLGFVPISQVRCDLVIPQDLLSHTGVKIALDTLQKKTFRNELNCLPGYDAACTGKTIAGF